MLNLVSNLKYQRADLLFLAYIQERNMRLLQDIYNSKPSNDKLLGCMIGLAVGDILGCPVEGMTFQEISQRYGYVKSLITPTHWKNWRLAGLHSDDTQQALVILDALQKVKVKYGSFTNNNEEISAIIAKTYVEGIMTHKGSFFGCWRGTGKGFRTVVEKLYKNKLNKNWFLENGEPSAGIGAAMRIPPVGIVIDKKEDLFPLVYFCTIVTHTDPTAIISAYLISYACFLLKSEDLSTFNPQNFLESIYDEAVFIESQPNLFYGNNISSKKNLLPINSSLIKTLFKLIGEKPNVAINAIASETNKTLGKPIIPTAGYGPSGIAASIYFFINNFKDSEQAILAGINAGWDTDSIGAILGSLLGTLHGSKVCERITPTIIALDLIINKVNHLEEKNKCNEIDLVKEEILLTIIEDNFKQNLKNIK